MRASTARLLAAAVAMGPASTAIGSGARAQQAEDAVAPTADLTTSPPAPPPSEWAWSFGGEVRTRYEAVGNDAWSGATEDDHDYVWWRALPWAELRHGSSLRARAQLVLAYETGDEAGEAPVDEDAGDLLQAFLEAELPCADGGPRPRLWAGRRVLAFGSERLISARYGPNVPRAFDAAGLTLADERWTLDLLWGRPVAVEDGWFDDHADDTRSLCTAYATCEVGDTAGLDLYWIGYEDELAEYEQGAGRERRQTVGLRSFGREHAWDWNVELFGQLGTFEDADVRAWSAATDAGWSFELASRRARLGLRANAISGDDQPGDDELGTFQAMFPKGKYFGELGWIGPANLINLRPSLEIALSDRWTATCAVAFYWRESTGDGLYGIAGDQLGPGSRSDEPYIGTQLDLGLEYEPRPWLDASLGLSALLPGAFLEDFGVEDPVLFAGLDLRLSLPGGR